MTFDADDDSLLSPQPVTQPKLVTIGTPTVSLGGTHWFDDDISYGMTVESLQAEGKLTKSPYTLPLPYLSVSQIELYLKCPLQFYFRYIKGEKRPPGIAMVQGTTIHRAVEVGYKHVIEKAAPPELDLVLSTYSDSLDQNITPDVVWDPSEEETDEDILSTNKDKGKVKDQGVRLLMQWHQKKLPKVNPRSVEKSFITTMGNIPIVGRLDLVDRIEAPLDPNGAEAAQEMHPALDAIVDNKVVGKTWSQGMVTNKLQMTVYAHATGVPRQRYDLFVKTKTPKIAELLTDRSPQQIRWAAKTITDVATAISAGIFPPCSPESYTCNSKWCGYYSICRGAI